MGTQTEHLVGCCHYRFTQNTVLLCRFPVVGELVGMFTYEYCICDCDGYFHQMLRSPHALFKSKETSCKAVQWNSPKTNLNASEDGELLFQPPFHSKSYKSSSCNSFFNQFLYVA